MTQESLAPRAHADEAHASPRDRRQARERERCRRGLELWRECGELIRRAPSGGISVPSCTGERSYRVSLAGEGKCGCPDYQRPRKPCKHIYAALVWASKQRR